MRIVPVFGGPKTPATLWWLTGVMLLLEGLAQLSDRGWFGVFDLRSLMISYGAFWDFLFPPGTVDHPLFLGQPYAMLITHAFLHAGTIHVLMNTAVFIALGKTLAIYFGLRLTLLTMLISAIVSAVMFGLLETTHAPMVGASGVVFGLIGASLGARPNSRTSRSQGFGISVLLIFLYYLLMFVFSSLGVKGTLLPFVSAWSPVLIGLGGGAFLLKQASR